MRTEDMLQTVMGLLEIGQLAQAEEMAFELQARGTGAVALQLLGVINARLGRFIEARTYLEQGMALAPNDAGLLLNYGGVLVQIGQLDVALEVYDVALAIDPLLQNAQNCRGAALHIAGRYEEAITSYDRALIQQRDCVVFTNRAISLREMGRVEDALADCNAALEMAPQYVDALIVRATILQLMGDLGGALITLDMALAFDSQNSDALINQASVLKAMGRHSDALRVSDEALSASTNAPEAIDIRGSILRALGRNDEALAHFEEAVRLQPGRALFLHNRGNAFLALGKISEALADFERATQINPTLAIAQLNRSYCLLTLGRFEEGFPLYEWRKKLVPPIEAWHFDAPLLGVGDDIKGRTLFLYSTEQGLGDTIQFYRYALLARERGARVILSVQNALVALLANVDTGIQIVGVDIVPARFDFHAPLMSLPLIFGTTVSNIPAPTIYLTADPARTRHWHEIIGSFGFKVGIAWQGSLGPIDEGRSISLHHLAPLSQVPGVRLISLQKGAGSEQLIGLDRLITIETLGEEFDAGPDAFLDAAAVIMNLDLVITTDTAIAHLAGALGKPTWLALKYLPDWRWLLSRSDTPWYPGMQLFRQPAPGDWSSVVKHLQDALLRSALK